MEEYAPGTIDMTEFEDALINEPSPVTHTQWAVLWPEGTYRTVRNRMEAELLTKTNHGRIIKRFVGAWKFED